MKKYSIIFFMLFALLSFQVSAQILDDDFAQDTNQELESDYDKTDALFNEMFVEFPDSEKDISKTDSFDDAITRATVIAKDKGNINFETETDYPPLQGDMYIGIKDGSFKIFQDIMKKTTCTFTVVLNSNLDRSIKRMGLSLIYPKAPFAFIFRDVPSNGSQTRYITTTGDICYNISGVPDISINMCRIRQASGKECMNRLKWKDDIIPQ